MTDLEQLISETLHERADEAPRADGLARDVRQFHGRRARLRAGVAIAGAAAAVAAVVVPVALLASTSGVAPGYLPHGQSQSPLPTRTGDTQTIAYHGIEFEVPASWSINAQRCGTPTENTVLRDVGAVETCLIARPGHVSDVELLGTSRDWIQSYPGTFTSAHTAGASVRIGTYRGRTTMVVVPAVHVAMNVAVIDESIARQIVGSIRVVDTDQYGCAMQTDQLYAPAAKVPPGYHHRLSLLPDATSAALCKYTGGWLTASTELSRTTLDALRSAIAAAPVGYNHTNPNTYLASICTEDATEHNAGYIVHVHTAAGPSPGTTQDPQTLWAHVQTCGPLGISDGLAVRALTPRLGAALNAPLHTGYGYSMRLLPGPG
jgi:hypothetical protein